MLATLYIITAHIAKEPGSKYINVGMTLSIQYEQSGGFQQSQPMNTIRAQGLFQQFWEKAPGQNWGKKIDLTSKLGEINDTEHYKSSKIYTKNQFILDCIMPSIPLFFYFS